MQLNRREFMKTTALGAAGFLFDIPAFGNDASRDVLRFGLISDVHQDIMHDSIYRIGRFVNAMNDAHADFICQLGDFCQPHERNREFINHWRQFRGERNHALGNHDMDGGFSREQTVSYYQMPDRFYSFEKKGVQFIALDGNDPGGKESGYKRFIGKEQSAWLEEELASTDLPCVLFSHQPLDNPGGIENCADIRAILESANRKMNGRKIIACFSGHFHKDYALRIHGIPYIQINSASYYWLPEKLIHTSYSKEIHDAHPYIAHTSPYKEPLWALVTIDPGHGILSVEGRQTEWVGPNPWELGGSKAEFDPVTVGPRISDWRMPI